MHVEHDTITVIQTGMTKEIRARGKLNNQESLAFEQHPNGVSDGLVIVDDLDCRLMRHGDSFALWPAFVRPVAPRHFDLGQLPSHQHHIHGLRFRWAT